MSETLTAIELDESGGHSEREYSSLQLARRFGLHPRDMRFLDSSLRNLPSILVRRSVIIVNLELFKAIISAKEVLMFDPYYPHIQSVVPLMKHALSAFRKKRGGGGDDGANAAQTESAAADAAASSLSSSADADAPSTGASSAAVSAPSSLPLHLSTPVSPSPASSLPDDEHPTLADMAADVESSYRDRSLFGLRDREKEYEDWIEPHMPFEFIALELILMTVCRTLESRSAAVEAESQQMLSSASSSHSLFLIRSVVLLSASVALLLRFEVYNSSLTPLLSSSSTTLNEGSTLMHLLQLKNGLTSFEVVLEETGVAMKQVLEDDADMAAMFLTLKSRGQQPRMEETGEIEVLLETYLRKVDELENEVRTNVKSISLTEEHIQIRLDTVRNAMMKVDLLVTILTFAIAASALVASTFGMNLPSHLEQSPVAFYAVSAVMLVMTAALVRFGLRLCRRHKIDLFHVEPDEPKLTLPANGLRKYKKRSSPVHRMGAGWQQQQQQHQRERGGRGGGGGEAGLVGGLFDKEEWFSQTLAWKLGKLEELKEKQEKMRCWQQEMRDRRAEQHSSSRWKEPRDGKYME